MNRGWSKPEGSTIHFQVGSIIPKQGEVRNIDIRGYRKQIIWLECPNCKKSRWVNRASTYDKAFTGLCDKCYRASRIGVRRKKTQARFQLKNGYIFIRVYPEDFFHSMVGNNGYVSEHRLVMAQQLGRCLHRWELVHHKGIKYPKGSKENRGDNRIENLQLVTDDRHKQITVLERRIKYLEELLRKANIPFSGNNSK